MSDYLAPAFAIVLPNLGGIAGGFLTRRAIPDWYEHLKKPDWRPPNRAFGPVWTCLYSTMGFASYLVWRDGGGFEGDNRLPLAMFGTQLALNWAWTPIVFGAKSLKWGLVEIVALWGAVAGTIVTFYPVNKVAAALLVPYLGWVSLASALNYVLWRDNKDRTD
ncbi:translocator protein-like [Babylonia areolata]|uniref:translocator protein-like n=1 Tax=Babylonia areolata TaxID=304850 RepID=UPI003FD17AF0